MSLNESVLPGDSLQPAPRTARLGGLGPEMRNLKQAKSRAGRLSTEPLAGSDSAHFGALQQDKTWREIW